MLRLLIILLFSMSSLSAQVHFDSLNSALSPEEVECNRVAMAFENFIFQRALFSNPSGFIEIMNKNVQKIDRICREKIFDKVIPLLKRNKEKMTVEHFQLLVEYLTKLALENSLSQQTISSVSQCINHISDSGESLELIQYMSKVRNEYIACFEPQIGQKKIVDEQLHPGHGDYIVEPVDENNYKISFAIALKETEESTETADNMWKRINQCIDDISPYFINSQGKKIQLNLLTTPQAQNLDSEYRIKETVIEIGSADIRSNSLKYASNVGCSTIIHEIFHLFGLADEYDGTKDGAHCRVTVEENSLMANHSEAISDLPSTLECECIEGRACDEIMSQSSNNELKEMYLSAHFVELGGTFKNTFCSGRVLKSKPFDTLNSKASYIVESHDENSLVVVNQVVRYQWPNIERERYTCKCPKSNTNCKLKISEVVDKIQNKRFQTRRCPVYSNERGSKLGIPSSPQQFNKLTKSLQIPNRGRNKSLLHDNHFNKVITGNCKSANKDYSECSIYAYPRYGAESQSCSSKPPPKCFEKGVFLGERI